MTTIEIVNPQFYQIISNEKCTIKLWKNVGKSRPQNSLPSKNNFNFDKFIIAAIH